MVDKFMYPEAGGILAPRGVRETVQRVRELPLHLRSQLVPLFPLILGSSTAPYKASKIELSYVDITPIEGNECQNCIHGVIQMMTRVPFCAAMQFEVAPGGWCDRWTQEFIYPWDLVEIINKGVR